MTYWEVLHLNSWIMRVVKAVEKNPPRNELNFGTDIFKMPSPNAKKKEILKITEKVAEKARL
ncbi:hypothetical protein ASB7_09720 [Helicobacter ailurogastricus]|nr:hypothetical protein ASB7_09720 [Helicobacter ailurogastricus]GLH58498.1 hypothetical protein NHP214376_12890 [Helicobacter ailurogastricus]GLH60078.1 hypothetical protein NHP214377_13500 [Helicobacter ailurogastricus]